MIDFNELTKGKKAGIILASLIVLSFIVMSLSFTYTTAYVDLNFIRTFYQSFKLLFMNFLPIFIIMTIVFLISNRLWLGYGITTILITALGVANKNKLIYRDDPVNMEELKLINESLMMAGRYEIKIGTKLLILTILCLALTFLVKKYLDIRIDKKKTRAILLVVVILFTFISAKTFYFDWELYNEIGNKEIINRWIESQRKQSKGMVYAFAYSGKELKDYVVPNYDEEEAKEDLFKYEYVNIPEDKKINIIGVMLEAYNDFSKFEGVEFEEDPYEYYHKLREESLHGNIITNVFAGGTIDTERAYLTGYQDHPKYNKQTNSYPWYFKEQGYRTEAMHPITGSFYNRRNVNELIGFDEFHHYDNKYEAIRKEYFMDYDFFDFIIEGFDRSMADGENYFHFSVTYQNHGPYEDYPETDGIFLKKKPGYNDSDYNIINNYLSGIAETDKALEKMVDRFKDEKEPVVLVFFGDHNPWLGNNNSGFNMLDINMDLGTVDGFRNYYETPYFIWANDAAKEVAGKDFIGEMDTISPNLIMPSLFEYIGWEGNEYTQALMDYKKNIDVHHKLYFKEDGEFKEELSEVGSEIHRKYRNFEYYWNRNYIDRD